MFSNRQITIKTRYLCAASLFLIMAYLSVWFSMPLYPDEVAFRLLNSRALYDGPVSYGLFALCPSNARPIPLLLLPAAYSFSAIDWASGWKLIRWLPFSATILLLAATSLPIMRGKRNGFEALFLCSGFIGIAGAGLILSRVEFVYNIQVAFLIFTWWLSTRQTLGKHSIIALALINIYLCTLSLFGHPQALLFLPITALLLLRLLLRHAACRPKFIVPIIAVGFLYFVLTAHSFWIYHCKEDPEFEAGLWSYFTNADKITSPAALWDILSNRIADYTNVFHFSQRFPIDMLPEIHEKHYMRRAAILDPLMNVLALAGIAGVCLIAVGLLPRFCRASIEIIKTRFAWRPMEKLLLSDWLLMFYAAIAWIFLLVYDALGNFYRTFSMNLFAVILIALVVSNVSWRPLKALVSAFGIIAAAVCLLSFFEIRSYIEPALDAGYMGPSITLLADWPQIAGDVAAVEKQCRIADGESDIVIDDLTYDAMKTHPHLMPITYVWWRNNFLRQDPASATPALRLESLKKAAHAMVTNCNAFAAYGIEYQGKEGGVCCARFK